MKMMFILVLQHMVNTKNNFLDESKLYEHREPIYDAQSNITHEVDEQNNVNMVNYIVYSGMWLVFPIAIHTIETIKLHNTCTCYIHKSKKRKRSKNTTLQW